MSYNGTVNNGVVVLRPGARRLEGTIVRVEAKTPAQPSDAGRDPHWRMEEQAADTDIPDRPVSIGHFLYGHPNTTNVSKRLL